MKTIKKRFFKKQFSEVLGCFLEKGLFFGKHCRVIIENRETEPTYKFVTIHQ